MLSLQHLSVIRKGTTVLKDVSIDIEPKDVVCILGEEGSGKTTLLKLLTREIEPEEGVIKIDGAHLSQLPREVLRMYRNRLGILPENATLDPTLTLEQNIRIALDDSALKASDHNRAASDLLKRLQLTSVASKRPTQVSRGEVQLTAFARAIAKDPVILLLDEPFQGLADATAKVMATLLQNMSKRGATVILASAEERTVGFFSSARIVRLERGKLTEASTGARPMQRAQEAAEVAMDHLVKRASPVTPVHASEEKTPESIETTQTPEGKKKIRITAVGSL